MPLDLCLADCLFSFDFGNKVPVGWQGELPRNISSMRVDTHESSDAWAFMT